MPSLFYQWFTIIYHVAPSRLAVAVMLSCSHRILLPSRRTAFIASYCVLLPWLHPVLMASFPAAAVVFLMASFILLVLPCISSYCHGSVASCKYCCHLVAVLMLSAYLAACGSIWTKKSKIVRFCQMNTHDMNRSQTCRCKCLPPMLLIHSPVAAWKRMAKVKCECKQQLSNMVQPPATTTTTTNNNIIIIVKIATNML